MDKKHPPILAIVLVILVVLALAAGAYYLLPTWTRPADTSLTASGSIETTIVNVAPEIGGKVTAVLVDEGASVKSGDVLFKLDDSLLQGQQAVAQANLDAANGAIKTANAALATAQAQYTLAEQSAHKQAASTRTADWTADPLKGYTLPGWFYNQTEAIAAAQTEVEAARTSLDEYQTTLDDLQNDPAAANFIAVEGRLNHARAAFAVADTLLTEAKDARDNAELELAAQKRYDSAQTDLDDAQSDYDDLADRDVAKNILTARANLAAARERYDTAQDNLNALLTGNDSPELAAAQAALHQAQVTADQADLAVKQAQAALDLLSLQIDKMTVKAPSDGVILTRSIEPGEVIPTGATALAMGDLGNLTITVYIPEDRYGEVRLGEQATVTVDSYQGVNFTASVIHIADQAEFTPRNVQTVSGRKSTVFAIKLQVQDPNGQLRPGMPADVVFEG
jgi:HlyD family secretion protein